MDPYLVVVFFFKQKTAYEMRISDWSSDVCSSDLLRSQRNLVGAGRAKEFDMLAGHAPGLQGGTRASDQRIDDLDIPASRDKRDARIGELACRRFVGRRVTGLRTSRNVLPYWRSEERRGGTKWVRTCRLGWAECQ